MNVRLHERAEGIIYQSMRLNPAQSGELLGDNPYSKVTHTALGAFMTRVHVALIYDLEFCW